MTWIIIAGGTALLGIIIGLLVAINTQDEEAVFTGGLVGALVGVGLALFGMLMMFIISNQGVDNLVSFHDDTQLVLRQEAAEALTLANLNAADPLVAVTRLETVGLRLHDTQEQIRDFNARLASHRRWQSSLWGVLAFQNVPDRIQPIDAFILP